MSLEKILQEQNEILKALVEAITNKGAAPDNIEGPAKESLPAFEAELPEQKEDAPEPELTDFEVEAEAIVEFGGETFEVSSLTPRQLNEFLKNSVPKIMEATGDGQADVANLVKKQIKDVGIAKLQEATGDQKVALVAAIQGLIG